jgi:hypothetical protein
MFLEECINIVKNNPTFPVSAFEILLKYKNNPEVIKIFNLITDGKLRRIYADIDLLANQEVYLKDKRY